MECPDQETHAGSPMSRFEVVLLRLKLPVEGSWDCPGGHVSILRLGKDLVSWFGFGFRLAMMSEVELITI